MIDICLEPLSEDNYDSIIGEIFCSFRLYSYKHFTCIEKVLLEIYSDNYAEEQEEIIIYSTVAKMESIIKEKGRREGTLIGIPYMAKISFRLMTI